MAQNLKLLSLISVIVILLAGCSAGASTPASSPAVQQPSSSPGSTQSSTPATQQGTTSSGQQGNRGQGGQGGPGGQNMSKVLSSAAQILGIDANTFTSAYQAAQKSVMGSAPTENRTRGGQPPSGGTGGRTSENRTFGGQPPSGNGGGQAGSQIMNQVYAQMATTLGISSDKISAAMQQAIQEVGNQSTTTSQ